MSYQYAITTNITPRLSALAERLEARGLMPLESTETKLVLARFETPQNELQRWGGDVELLASDGTVLVTINTSDHRAILQDILDEFEKQGISVTVEEP